MRLIGRHHYGFIRLKLMKFTGDVNLCFTVNDAYKSVIRGCVLA